MSDSLTVKTGRAMMSGAIGVTVWWTFGVRPVLRWSQPLIMAAMTAVWAAWILGLPRFADVDYVATQNVENWGDHSVSTLAEASKAVYAAAIEVGAGGRTAGWVLLLMMMMAAIASVSALVVSVAIARSGVSPARTEYPQAFASLVVLGAGVLFGCAWLAADAGRVSLLSSPTAWAQILLPAMICHVLIMGTRSGWFDRGGPVEESGGRLLSWSRARTALRAQG